MAAASLWAKCRGASCPPAPDVAMSVLYVVRHAMPDVDPDQEPASWPLSEAGRSAAHALVKRLPEDALLVASDEPKAWQTLDPTGDGSGVTKDARLREVRREEQFSDDFRVARRAYVDGADHAGWENRRAVAARMQAAVDEQQAAAGERPLVIAGHGMSLTVWITAAVGLSDPGAFWAALRFPDLLAIDLSAGDVRRCSATGTDRS